VRSPVRPPVQRAPRRVPSAPLSAFPPHDSPRPFHIWPWSLTRSGHGRLREPWHPCLMLVAGKKTGGEGGAARGEPTSGSRGFVGGLSGGNGPRMSAMARYLRGTKALLVPRPCGRCKTKGACGGTGIPRPKYLRLGYLRPICVWPSCLRSRRAEFGPVPAKSARHNRRGGR